MNTLEHALLAAFPAWPPPAADSICIPCCDDEGVGEFFTGKRWPELTAQELRDHPFAPTVFMPATLAYYLPAFIRHYYTDRDMLDCVAESLIANLGADVAPNDGGQSRARMVLSSLSHAQRELVCRFVSDFASTEGICAEPIYASALALYDDAARRPGPKNPC